jgi:uncharacterized protein YjbJ (UPF0337 family)
MSNSDRFDAAKDDVKGQTKEGFGKLTGDDSKEAEGKVDQFKGDAKSGMADGKDKVADKANDLMDKVKGNDNH